MVTTTAVPFVARVASLYIIVMIMATAVEAFTVHHVSHCVQSQTSATQLGMVFDFFKKRSIEGLQQVEQLTKSAAKGQLGQGLKQAANYTKQTNQAFADGLAKSRVRLLQNLETVLTGKSSQQDMLDELLDVLLQADLGMRTSEDIVSEVQSLMDSSSKRLGKTDLKSIMRGKIIETIDLAETSRAIQFSQDTDMPTVLFIMGANGMGKTTTIGKLAHRLRTEGNQTVLVAACDTFRAGAVDQLQQWADRAQVDQFSPTETATTPSAVLYAALDKAIKEKYDTLIVDTSGRLSNNDALTAELLKMKRVIQKRMSKETVDGKPQPNTDVPHETLLVIDAAQGRMALDSAKIWHEEIGLTGLILTKLDGSARGGSVVAVTRDLKLPVKLIGVGEGIEDLRDFEPEAFVDSLLGVGVAAGKSATEGAKLAARLEQMRKERDSRAKLATKNASSTKKVEPVGVSAAAPAPVSPQPVSGGNVSPLTGANVPNNPNRPKNRRKKKGKR